MNQNENFHSSNFDEAEIPKDLICFSHLRWNFVYQRPQHLLTRFSKHFRLFFLEEPEFTDSEEKFSISNPEHNMWVIVPQLKRNQETSAINARLKELLASFFETMEISDYMFWYYTPMAMSFSSGFNPRLTVYDCMDELSAFKFAPPELKQYEQDLLSKADLVFTGGHSLYEAKKHSHPSIYPFPSSIDKKHFAEARKSLTEPSDQESIPSPRFGFYGVIDERMDIDLIREVAERRPNWHFVLVGPVVKIDPASLPKNENIHYPGGKSYSELPSYLSGWDIALIPFARNESTQFISPTKTPEYLAGGKPVISTSIRDVINPYKTENLVHIADTADEFIQAAELELDKKDKSLWLQKVDDFLSDNSWDNTWKKMMELIVAKLKENTFQKIKTKERLYV